MNALNVSIKTTAVDAESVKVEVMGIPHRFTLDAIYSDSAEERVFMRMLRALDPFLAR